MAPEYRQKGAAKELLRALFDVGRFLGCREAWVLTEKHNTAAVRLYESLGGKESDQLMFAFRL